VIAGAEIDFGKPYNFSIRIQTHQDLLKVALNRLQFRHTFINKLLIKSVLLTTDIQLNLTYTMDMETDKNYSIWLHSAEIVSSVTNAGI
jgi:hypothetical protein